MTQVNFSNKYYIHYTNNESFTNEVIALYDSFEKLIDLK